MGNGKKTKKQLERELEGALRKISELEKALQDKTRSLQTQTSSRKELDSIISALEHTHEIAQIGHWEYDIAADKLTWSKEIFRIFGIPEEKGEPNWEEHKKLVHPDDGDKMFKAVHAAITEGKPYSEEYRIMHPDGSILWGHTTARPIRNEQGKTVKLCGTVQDITARKHAEHNLAETIQKLNAHIDNSPLGVVEFDPDLRVIRWSKTAEEIFGWTAEDMIGKTIFEVPWVYAEDIELVNTATAELVHGKKKRSVDVNRNCTKDGRIILCEWYSSRIYDKDHKLISILSLVLDITERQKAATALRKSEELFRTLAENSPEIIVRFDKNLRHIYVNPAIEKITGIPRKDFIGKTNEELGMPAKNIGEWNEKLLNVIASGIPDTFVFSFNTTDESRTFFSRLVPEDDGGGAIKSVLCITSDITESLKKEKELEEQQLLLESKNFALKELVDQVQHERQRIEKTFLANIEQLILPLINRIKTGNIANEKKALQILEDNLQSITSDFAEKVSDKLHALTNREIEICNLIKHGMSSKEIAEILNISTRGVETHRRNIRKKLGITRNKVNLASYLNHL